MEVQIFSKVLRDDAWFNIEELLKCTFNTFLEIILGFFVNEDTFNEILCALFIFDEILNGLERLLGKLVIIEHPQTLIENPARPSLLKKFSATRSTLNMVIEACKVLNSFFFDEKLKVINIFCAINLHFIFTAEQLVDVDLRRNLDHIFFESTN